MINGNPEKKSNLTVALLVVILLLGVWLVLPHIPLPGVIQ
jgi:hypothetical protein